MARSYSEIPLSSLAGSIKKENKNIDSPSILKKINGEKKPKCTLCGKKLKTEQRVVCTPCWHVFCWGCIEERLKVSNRCPKLPCASKIAVTVGQLTLENSNSSLVVK